MKCNLKEYIALKLDYEMLKNSDLHKTNLKEYISKLLDMEIKLRQFKFN
ncbi:MAG: hypothetical protein MJ149_00345 [Clostridia bacterium]|nr:hypothetical protein [Clostridia bacterium]MCQ2564648.1 hypothetical protein [Clostridia bacterium]